MSSISPQARSRRRRRKLLLAVTVAGGAALMRGRTPDSLADEQPFAIEDADHAADDDDVELGRQEEPQNGLWN